MKHLVGHLVLKVKAFARRHPVALAWLIGIVYEGYQLSWLRHTKLGDIAPDAFVVKLLYVATIMIAAAALSIVFPLFVIAWRRLRLSWREARALWLAPVLWMGLEFLQSFIFSIVIYGRFGRIGSFLTFGSPGYYLVETPLVFLSRIGGLWLLSGVVMLLLIGLAQLIFIPKHRLNVLIALGLVIIASQASWYIWQEADGSTQSLAVLQIENGKNITELDPSINPALQGLPEKSFDAVILPEYSHYFEFTRESDVATMKRLVRDDASPVIDSYQERSARPFINYLTYRNAEGSILNRQHKWFLAPGGEYLPYFLTVPLRLSGNEKIINDYVYAKQVSAARQPELPYAVGAVNYGALACSGVVSPEIYRGMTARGAMLLTNSGSLDTLGLSRLYHDQSETIGRFHAVANARPFIQSARGSYSYAYDHNGQLITRDDSFATRAMSVNVQANTKTTLYTLFGDWAGWLSLGVVIGGLLLTQRRVVRGKNY